METVDYLKKFDYPNIIELRFYNWDYMIAFAEYYHKEKLNELKGKEEVHKGLGEEHDGNLPDSDYREAF